jgi:carnitine O-acetyltransferase
MVNQQSPSEVLYRKFKAALQAHVSLTRKAVTGKGVDRHLLGLALVMRDDETSPLFDDSLYSKSQEWLLSTSGLSEGERFIGTG